jgi:hypothetical protein
MRCSRVAAPGGSDANVGTVAAPFATAQHLIDSLRAGEVGCLRRGIYAGNITVARGGSPGKPLTLTSFPGQYARLVGRLYVRARAHYLRFLRLGLDGLNGRLLPSPTVLGSDVTFSGDDVTNQHSSICFDLGFAGGEIAQHIDIERSLVHACGRVPADNHEHGIYVENTRDVRIAWNLIFANADRGVQLYPNAQDTRILHNVIYGNGEGVLIAGGAHTASSQALVAHNIIGDSDVRSNVESWYESGSPGGRDNIVTENCIGASILTRLNASSGGFSASGNLLAEPPFADPGAGDFSMPAHSPCMRLSGDVPAVVAAAR